MIQIPSTELSLPSVCQRGTNQLRAKVDINLYIILDISLYIRDAKSMENNLVRQSGGVHSQSFAHTNKKITLTENNILIPSQKFPFYYIIHDE